MIAAATGLTSVPLTIVVAARNEADLIGKTVAALTAEFPQAKVVVADDASEDATAEVAAAHGATVVSGEQRVGKGGNVMRALAEADRSQDRPADADAPGTYLLCDGDLGETAARLAPLVDAVAAGECDMAIAEFARRRGGGFGIAVGYAHDAIERLCGFDARAPISGQRALNAAALRTAVPLAGRYGMEIGMTVDVVRAGFTVHEIELDLDHRVTDRSLGGFVHRARQLRDFRRVAKSRT